MNKISDRYINIKLVMCGIVMIFFSNCSNQTKMQMWGDEIPNSNSNNYDTDSNLNIDTTDISENERENTNVDNNENIGNNPNPDTTNIYETDITENDNNENQDLNKGLTLQDRFLNLLAEMNNIEFYKNKPLFRKYYNHDSGVIKNIDSTFFKIFIFQDSSDKEPDTNREKFYFEAIDIFNNLYETYYENLFESQQMDNSFRSFINECSNMNDNSLLDIIGTNPSVLSKIPQYSQEVTPFQTYKASDQYLNNDLLSLVDELSTWNIDHSDLSEFYFRILLISSLNYDKHEKLFSQITEMVDISPSDYYSIHMDIPLVNMQPDEIDCLHNKSIDYTSINNDNIRNHLEVFVSCRINPDRVYNYKNFSDVIESINDKNNWKYKDLISPRTLQKCDMKDGGIFLEDVNLYRYILAYCGNTIFHISIPRYIIRYEIKRQAEILEQEGINKNKEELLSIEY